MKRFSFPKSKRLVSNRQFKAVLDQRQSVGDELLVLYLAANDCGHSRLGISVSRLCGKAVVRNRLKRLLREAFRQSQEQIPADFDYVVMISPRWSKKRGESLSAKEAAMKLKSGQVRERFLALVERAKKKFNI